MSPTQYAVIAVTTDPPAPPLTMAERIDSEIDADPMGHQWVGQATVSLDAKTAKRAAFRGSFRTEANMRVDVLDVMCHVCRRTYDAVQAIDAEEIERVAALNAARTGGTAPAVPNLHCPGQIDNSHLIGGDLSVRAKRIIHQPVGVIQHHVIDRRGADGYSVHAGK